VPADDELDTAPFARKVADLVGVALANGGMSAGDAATVFVNTPSPATGDKPARGRRARAVAALGAGIALGEIAAEHVADKTIGADASLYTMRVQTFTGPTVKQVEVIVLGNRAGAGGSLIACSAVTNDLLDTRPLKRTLVGAGLRLDADGELAEPDRVVAALIKSGARTDGHVLGAPTVIFRGGLPPEKQVRAAQSGVFGALLKTTCMFNTYDPIQQAPEGGSQACCVVRVS
jgi:cyanuric acid amidohydrolase